MKKPTLSFALVTLLFPPFAMADAGSVVTKFLNDQYNKIASPAGAVSLETPAKAQANFEKWLKAYLAQPKNANLDVDTCVFSLSTPQEFSFTGKATEYDAWKQGQIATYYSVPQPSNGLFVLGLNERKIDLSKPDENRNESTKVVGYEALKTQLLSYYQKKLANGEIVVGIQISKGYLEGPLKATQANFAAWALSNLGIKKDKIDFVDGDSNHLKFQTELTNYVPVQYKLGYSLVSVKCDEKPAEVIIDVETTIHYEQEGTKPGKK